MYGIDGQGQQEMEGRQGLGCNADASGRGSEPWQGLDSSLGG